VSHLGMTGSFRVETELQPPRRHDHFELTFEGGKRMIYHDPRRFGFLKIYPTSTVHQSSHLAGLGLEPLSNNLDGETLHKLFNRPRRDLKSLLLDQGLVAGLGNIYALEALHLAGLAPSRKGSSLSPLEASKLTTALITVLRAALDSGGSTINDYVNASGDPGYFQHQFAVYGREGEACPHPDCEGTITRISQQGRSTYFCPSCQI
ncbi:hypothetical protein CAPTEDRAFT_118139, partial [Capitella teleta]